MHQAGAVAEGTGGMGLIDLRAMEEEEIVFEEMRPRKRPGMNMRWDDPKEETPRPKFVPGHYASLYVELRTKCNPKEFMDDYEYQRLEAANDIYTLAEEHKDDEGALKGLRARAMAELGVRFATEDLYGELVRALTPAAFAGEREKFRFANELYNQVLLHADDVVALERLKAKSEEEGAPLGIGLGPEGEPPEGDDVDWLLLAIGLLGGIIVMVFVFAAMQ